MRVLLDTHVFLWYFAADPRFNSVAATIMADVRNELLISTASLWEIGIKTANAKLKLPAPFGVLIPQQLHQANIKLLEIKVEHIATGCTLPFHHKDPFDRMLAAQCSVENTSLEF